jgi:hypothetical protein
MRHGFLSQINRGRRLARPPGASNAQTKHFTVTTVNAPTIVAGSVDKTDQSGDVQVANSAWGSAVSICCACPVDLAFWVRVINLLGREDRPSY